MKKYFLNKKGTTFIELIVSIAIIAIISGTVLANFHSSERTNNLHVATQKLASDIRQAQNYAMSLKSHGGTTPPGGWGIYFNKTAGNRTSYKMFADTDTTPDHYCDNFNQCRNTDADFFQTLELPEGIEISDLNTDIASLNRMQISFEPPTPAVYICGTSACNNNEAKITLSNGGETSTIIVNKFGLVDIQ